ncbi:hypothetical protein G8764_16360 [Pseudomaricurvus alcaniphilus]|uniref:hypothetical protein n=1 Tax=Pseudomaricurvus alcaniphilus TaxID=1166482 RepID=UPI00140A4B6E|nr:hypothetical protein [Pseudomaricurvus alcaniphilus]NHN38885.1 hypothetical protein [Pseudomaricurvus alcaniphilus]
MEELDKMTPAECLIAISENDLYSPSFYPSRYAHAGADEVIRQLPAETQLRLAKWLKGKQRSSWRKFKSRLLSKIGTP